MSQIREEILSAARRSSNFGLLEEIEPLPAVYGAGAEATVYTDPNGALIKCRQFGEVLTEQLLQRTSTVVVSTKQIDGIAALASAGVLQADPVAALHLIRRTGNDATHSHLFNSRLALDVLRACWDLGTLLYRAVRVIGRCVPSYHRGHSEAPIRRLPRTDHSRPSSIAGFSPAGRSWPTP